MHDGVPTRFERIAAVAGIAAVVSAMATATFGYVGVAVALLPAAFVCGAVARVRVSLESLRRFGLREVAADDPEARRYEERRRREASRMRAAVDLAYDPQWDRIIAVVLAIVGIGALALVPFTADGEFSVVARLLLVGVVAITLSLVVSASSYVDSGE